MGAKLTDVVCARDGCERRCTELAVRHESPAYCSAVCVRLVHGCPI